MAIRIIAGKYKGRMLEVPPTLNTRPTMGRVRQVLFDLLMHLPAELIGDQGFTDKTIFEGYAGSGAMGFEALSRGAKQVIFVENAPLAHEYLQKNRLKLHCLDQTEVLKTDVLTLPKADFPRDIVLLDPPYQMPNLEAMIQSLADKGWVKIKGLMALETAKDRPLDLSSSWQLIKDRTVGPGLLRIYQYQGSK